MFEMSFGEILLIGVVALVVLGPERLPVVARTLGALVGRAQRFVATVKADIQQQANLQGLESLKSDIHDAATAFRDKFDHEVQETRQVFLQHEQHIHQAIAEARDSVTVHEHDAEGAGPQPVPVPHDEPAQPVSASVGHNDNQLDLFDPPPESSPTAVTRTASHQ